MKNLRAFTIVELLIAVSVVAILSVVTIVNTLETRRAARDANRRSSVEAYTTAMEQWKSVSPYKNYFVQVLGGAACAASNSANTSGATGAGYMSASNFAAGSSSCVGYLGGGAGRITRKNITNKYGTRSIADALKDAGVLNAVRYDPSVEKLATNDDAGTINNDFILTTCTTAGRPADLPSTATEFAVYANLENATSGGNDTAVVKSQCGGENSPYGWDTIQ